MARKEKQTDGSLRGILENFSVPQIKDLVAAAGLPVERLTSVRGRKAGGASKGALLDAVFSALDPGKSAAFLSRFLTEMVRTRPDLEKEVNQLARSHLPGDATSAPPTLREERPSHRAGAAGGQMRTPSAELLTKPFMDFLDSARGAVQTISKTVLDPPKDRTVFVVYGRNGRMREAMFAFLRSLDLRPLEWSEAVEETGKAAPYVGEVLDRAFDLAEAVVILMTPDDEARLREEFRRADEPHEAQLIPQARPNVLFEAGMALGRHPDRTVLIEIGRLRSFSDIGGRHVIKLDNSPAKRKDVAERLRRAGCAVNTVGSDWLREGDFADAPNNPANPNR